MKKIKKTHFCSHCRSKLTKDEVNCYGGCTKCYRDKSYVSKRTNGYVKLLAWVIVLTSPSWIPMYFLPWVQANTEFIHDWASVGIVVLAILCFMMDGDAELRGV